MFRSFHLTKLLIFSGQNLQPSCVISVCLFYLFVFSFLAFFLINYFMIFCYLQYLLYWLSVYISCPGVYFKIFNLAQSTFKQYCITLHIKNLQHYTSTYPSRFLCNFYHTFFFYIQNMQEHTILQNIATNFHLKLYFSFKDNLKHDKSICICTYVYRCSSPQTFVVSKFSFGTIFIWPENLPLILLVVHVYWL